MGEVGHLALAAAPGQHPLGHPGDLRRLEHGGHPAGTQVVGPGPQRLADPVGEVVATGVQAGGGLAEEHRGRRRADQPGAVRLLERLEQAEPVLGRLRGEDVEVAGVDGRDAGLGQRLATGPRVLVRLDDHRDVAGLHRAVGVRRAGGQQPADVGGQVAGDVVAQDVDGDGLAGADAELLAARHSQPERRVGGRAGQPAALVVGRDLADHDVRVPELGAAEHHLQGVDQRLVAAPVGAQGPPLAGGLRRLEVRRDVAAAERVDGLLGVTDEDQRAVPVEGRVDDLPLHRVGVLELVDHHHRPAAAHPLPGRGGGVLEGGGQPGQQVVVAEDAEPTLAALDLGEDGQREVDSHALGRARGVLLRDQPGVRVADHLGGDLERGRTADRGRLGRAAEALEVEVVDDLGDQVAQVVDQGHPGVGVTGDTERAQHQLAELVRGGDGGGVEVGQRVAQPGVRGLGVVQTHQVAEQTGVVTPAAPGPRGHARRRAAARARARAAPGWRRGRR